METRNELDGLGSHVWKTTSLDVERGFDIPGEHVRWG